MSAFIVVHGTPKDMAGLKTYSAAAAPTFAPFGGEILGKGKPEVLAGSHDSQLVAVICFPDVGSARAWYTSPAYQALIPERDLAMDSTFVLCG